jgi:hypothetical protein
MNMMRGKLIEQRQTLEATYTWQRVAELRLDPARRHETRHRFEHGSA